MRRPSTRTVTTRSLQAVPSHLRHLVPAAALDTAAAPSWLASLQSDLDADLKAELQQWGARAGRRIAAQALALSSRSLATAIGTDGYADATFSSVENLAGDRYFAECVLTGARGKAQPSDDEIVARIQEARLVVLVAHLRTLAELGAHDVTVVPGPDDGELVIRPGRLDVDRFQRERVTVTDTGDDELRSLTGWVQGHEPAGIWGDVSRHFETEYGCDLRTFIRTLASLAREGITNAAAPYAVVRVDELVAALARTGCGDAPSVGNALRRLVFDEGAAREWLHPWRQRERVHRLAITPLFRAEVEDSLYVVPGFVALSLGDFLTHLASGSWPEPEGAPQHQTPFRKTLKSIEDARNASFEKMVVSEVRQHGFEAAHSVTRLPGIQFLGDVDCLAASKTGDEIWVVEAKDPIPVSSMPQTTSQLKNFERYWEKHLGRVAAIDTDLGRQAVAELLAVPLQPSCRVRSVMVTRLPSPINYFDQPGRPVLHWAQLREEIAHRTE